MNDENLGDQLLLGQNIIQIVVGGTKQYNSIYKRRKHLGGRPKFDSRANTMGM